MDGGVFVVSGRAMAIRANIVQSKEFLESFTNENIFRLPGLQRISRFGFHCSSQVKIGDDNFITTWVLNQGHMVKFQDAEDATIETTLGEAATFTRKCLRWRRTTYWSNICLLLTSPMVWLRWPWTVWLAYIPALFNLAFFWDFGMIFAFSQTNLYSK